MITFGPPWPAPHVLHGSVSNHSFSHFFSLLFLCCHVASWKPGWNERHAGEAEGRLHGAAEEPGGETVRTHQCLSFTHKLSEEETSSSFMFPVIKQPNPCWDEVVPHASALWSPLWFFCFELWFDSLCVMWSLCSLLWCGASLVVAPVSGHQGGREQRAPGEQGGDPWQPGETVWAECGEHERSQIVTDRTLAKLLQILSLILNLSLNKLLPYKLHFPLNVFKLKCPYNSPPRPWCALRAKWRRQKKKTQSCSFRSKSWTRDSDHGWCAMCRTWRWAVNTTWQQDESQDKSLILLYHSSSQEYIDGLGEATPPSQGPKMRVFVENLLQDVRSSYRAREEQLASAARSYKKRLQKTTKTHHALLIAYR